MGMELEQCEEQGGARVEDLHPESRPSILCVGAAGVGKTTIANRLRRDREVIDASSGAITCYGWKIDTKYYTANVGIWTARLEQEQTDEVVKRLESLSGQCEALVMVFDLSNDSSFDRLKNWASRADLTAFEILLCVGNKADRLPQHYGHVEYRRRLQRLGESSSDPHPEFLEFGIQRNEGSSLLDDEEVELAGPAPPVDEKKHSRIEWCIENGIEYIEACALNVAFDDCLSLDGDLQGVSRIRGALSAHMWPGMVMKPTPSKATSEAQACTQGDPSSDEESDFTIEYELLSSVSDDEAFAAESESHHREDQATDSSVLEAASVTGQEATADASEEHAGGVSGASETTLAGDDGGAHGDGEEEVGHNNGHEASQVRSSGNGSEAYRMDEFEQLMQEMAGMRENLSMMPDAQRREIASQIAMRMASMFMDDDDDE
ncbi:uncharacterized protein LOC9644396 [Selaginella moellendorffii]|uniref:uncharacterized protein LOC9644396 n=1 Tax=Selaginella moellendorffii TaxID=88036 RepID=UPI000D1CF44A|nr:uncharacterized protein LOC9644396 [Selaginella moellendorffii]|eukprot:XP_024545187.1 uncharacterized protein LOC9644396 [Selaginella moellendorffii]